MSEWESAHEQQKKDKDRQSDNQDGFHAGRKPKCVNQAYSETHSEYAENQHNQHHSVKPFLCLSFQHAYPPILYG